MSADQFYVEPNPSYVGPSEQERLPSPVPDPWPQAAGISSEGLPQEPGSVVPEYDPAVADAITEDGGE